jgi:hypothetical protein
MHHHTPMGFDRSFGGTKLKSNLLVQLAADHQGKDLALPRSQTRDKRSKGIKLALALLYRRMTNKRAFNRFQQCLSGYRLGEKVFSTRLDSAHAGGNIPVACQKNNRPTARQPRKLFLKLQPAEVWHLNVEHNAARFGIRDNSQETSCGFITHDLITGKFQYARNRPAKRHVVVYDMNYRSAGHCSRPYAQRRPGRYSNFRSKPEAYVVRPPDIKIQPADNARIAHTRPNRQRELLVLSQTSMTCIRSKRMERSCVAPAALAALQYNSVVITGKPYRR